MEQADLHAADVDVVRGRGADELDGLSGAVEELPIPIGIDGPGPGLHLTGGRITPAAFHLGDGREQALGDGVGLFGGHNSLLAGDRACRHGKRRQGEARPAEISPKPSQ